MPTSNSNPARTLGLPGQVSPRGFVVGSLRSAANSKKLGKAKGPQAPTLPCWRG